jgi:hypothetical protein
MIGKVSGSSVTCVYDKEHIIGNSPFEELTFKLVIIRCLTPQAVFYYSLKSLNSRLSDIIKIKDKTEFEEKISLTHTRLFQSIEWDKHSENCSINTLSQVVEMDNAVIELWPKKIGDIIMNYVTKDKLENV